MANCLDLGMRILYLLSESIVLTEEGVALLGEVVHLSTSLAKVALRVIERRLERVDQVNVGLQV